MTNLPKAGSEAPLGVILAGGAGRRIGGSKATVCLNGKPLICYPLEALEQVLPEVVVIAKASTEIPSLPGITVWVEPEEPRHPLVGILHGLSLAGARPALICATDLPCVTPEVVVALLSADPQGAPAVIATAEGRAQPLLGCYYPATLELLQRLGLQGDEPLGELIEAIGARRLEVEPRALFNVNYPEDLFQAEVLLEPPASSGTSSRT